MPYHRISAATTVAALALALTACQAGPTEAGPSSVPVQRPASAAAEAAPAHPGSSMPKCVAADVAGSFSEPETALGIQGVRVIVTNTTSHPCTIYGYGGVEFFAGGDGRPVGIALSRLPQPAPTQLTLQPGQKANKSLTWTPPSGPDATDGCTPFVGSAGVILPDDTQSITVDGDLGRVCDGGKVDGRPFAAGTG